METAVTADLVLEQDPMVHLKAEVVEEGGMEEMEATEDKAVGTETEEEDLTTEEDQADTTEEDQVVGTMDTEEEEVGTMKTGEEIGTMAMVGDGTTEEEDKERAKMLQLWTIRAHSKRMQRPAAELPRTAY
ncbi:hypothetical protein CBR_g58825 [Chara braunii]|uniref:Uncharacterized protein n=1 Tax=Chara braunii TaxID=69332 RepID=A0A388K8F5_CHABU|nr:hypothetical protein CBR_g58825 [Chara braunii]|eukprot:GBG66335.1 hypothetical protein CBR_g58825 [Chara braunii]